LAQVSRGSPFIALVHLSCVSPSGMAAGYPMAAAAGVRMGYSDTQAYLAVQRKDVENILQTGYKCERRHSVPVTLVHDMRGAVSAALQYPTETNDMVVLEVHGVPEEMIDTKKSKIKTELLESKYLRWGIIKITNESRLPTVPCPICKKMVSDVTHLAGRVGEAGFTGDVFRITACTDENCLQQQKARQDRLDEEPELTLYHQTSREVADLIKQTGRLIRGVGGAAGGGVYLAQTAKETEWKAEHHGVVLECKMKIGNVKRITQHDKKAIPDTTFATLLREGYDSVLLDRGEVPQGPHKGEKSGDEYVAYSWHQAFVIREVPRDKRTCDCCKGKPDKK